MRETLGKGYKGEDLKGRGGTGSLREGKRSLGEEIMDRTQLNQYGTRFWWEGCKTQKLSVLEIPWTRTSLLICLVETCKKLKQLILAAMVGYSYPCSMLFPVQCFLMVWFDFGLSGQQT